MPGALLWVLFDLKKAFQNANQSIREPVIILQWIKTISEHAVMMADLQIASIDRGASKALCSYSLLFAPLE